RVLWPLVLQRRREAVYRTREAIAAEVLATDEEEAGDRTAVATEVYSTSTATSNGNYFKAELTRERRG
ncbi:unnamed protein product, partial [Discosporangium mesarthrocarpum]